MEAVIHGDTELADNTEEEAVTDWVKDEEAGIDDTWQRVHHEAVLLRDSLF